MLRGAGADAGPFGRPSGRWAAVNFGAEGAELVDDGNDGDPREEIARLEVRLEVLDEALARCWKIKLIAQIALAGGALWMVAAILGLIGFDPVAMMAAIAAVIGGTVMYGSNTTTQRETEAAIADAEAHRAELIGSLQLRVVGEKR
jgi:hypothetical protein